VFGNTFLGSKGGLLLPKAILPIFMLFGWMKKQVWETWFLLQNAVFLKLRFGASAADSTITFFSESVIYLITHVHIKLFFTSPKFPFACCPFSLEFTAMRIYLPLGNLETVTEYWDGKRILRDMGKEVDLVEIKDTYKKLKDL
jgi:hypothetical protein